MVTISYFIIFAIISIVTGNPARNDREDSYQAANEFELQNLLQSLANQGSYYEASNNGQDARNTYQENRAGSERYDQQSRQVYNQYNKAKPQKYYKSYENGDEEQPNANDIKTINRFLQQNADNDDAQALIEELLSLDRNNNKPLQPSDENEDVNEFLYLLSNLQANTDDVANYRVYGKGHSNSAKTKKTGQHYNEPDAVLVQGKNRLLELISSIAQRNLQYNTDYPNLEYETYVGRNDNNEDSYNNRDNLRCNGKSCARTNRTAKNSNSNRLRCRGKNCARSRTDGNGSNLKYKSKLAAQKIKVNDELDAVVLGLSDVDHLLSRLSPKTKPVTNKLRVKNNAKLLQNLDLENLFNSKNNVGAKSNVEAVVFDLTQVENGDSVARQIKQILSQPNEASYDEYEDYGNLVEKHLKKGSYDIQKDIIETKASPVILAHNENNNNVYLPQWLLNEVVRSYKKKNPVVDKSKTLFPSARQQKAKRSNKAQSQKTPRIFRRNAEQDVGVPFHLEVEGLGQVNP